MAPIGPDELVRLAHIAREHYIAGKTRVEIAEELGLSRFKVGRLLDDAVKCGIVTFDISVPGPVDVESSLKLQRRFGLTRAVVVRTPTDASEAVQEELGKVGAELLAELAAPDDVIGMTAGRTLGRLADSLGALPGCEVVQLAGVAGPVQATGVEVIRRVAEAARSRGWTLYAPIVASDPEAAAAIRRQHDVQQTMHQYSKVTLALVAIGSWAPADSQFFDNPALTAEDHAALLASGVQADIGSILIDRDGKTVNDIQDRCVAIDADELRRIPEVIGVAGGALKHDAVRAALRSGLIDSLVTDSTLANRLLENS
ncbi:DNA-binding transcriptional regulator [Arthrobacter sp. Sa2CUA1]|uniref:DNA-binding transcriptional regulator n=1 Tax=Arthrobacter gallicola TaxID=2762225 RepID=A0ABR8UT52_9MICC|nr:sugar-binding domain-containing protein [Arthrobacter gallicola]MBD7995688.1 DNA-binding transcriptional regulator [Arthrobacter gallicola]